MNSKFLYTIAGIVVILAAGIIFFVQSNKKSEDNSTDQYSSESNPSNDQTTVTQNNSTNQTMTDTTTADPCKDASQRDANGKFKPAVDISNKTVTLDTTMGKIVLKFYDKDAPKTVQNFICLAQKGYFDKVKFHRVAHGFVIQSGDPTGTGSGGESIYGGKFEDELDPTTPSYKAGYVKGTLAMANSGPNTNGSQFFIMTSDVGLDHKYTIFGKVSSGLDVVEKIGAVPVTPGFGPEDGAPVQDIFINKATVK